MSGLIVNLGIIEATTPVGGGHGQPVDLRAIEAHGHLLEREGLMATHNVPHVRQEHIDLGRPREPPPIPHARPPPPPRPEDLKHASQPPRLPEPLHHAHHAQDRPRTPPPPERLAPLQVSESEVVRQAREHTFADFTRVPAVPHIDPKAVHITPPAHSPTEREVASLAHHTLAELERVVPHVKPEEVPITLPADDK